MSRPPRPLPPALLLLVDLPLVALSALILVLLVQTAGGRLFHPYDLEWMEGGMLVHALRVQQGLPLYVQPSADFVPFIYPPLYHWLVAALGLPMGLGYGVGRCISLVGTLLGAGALATAVRLEGGKGAWISALGAAALFLSTYDEAGAFFDLVRIDGLLIALVGWSLLAVRWGWLRSGGLLLVLAYLTKHNAAIFGLPCLIWLWRSQGRGPALRYALWSVLPALLATAALQLEGDGLFLTYLLGVPAHHAFVFERFWKGAPMELMGAMPWALGLILLPALGWSARQGGLHAGHRFWAGQGAVAILICMIMRGHGGGYLNVLIPALWALSLWVGLSMEMLRGAFFGRPQRALAVRGATVLVLSAQLFAGRWDPASYQPTAADREAGDRLVQRIAEVDGEVWAPWSPWLVHQAGKKPGLHLIGLWDVDDKQGPLYDGVLAIDAEVRSARWAVILTANDNLGHGLKDAYRKAENVRPAGNRMAMKTGWRVRPASFWRPRDSAPSPEGTSVESGAAPAEGAEPDPLP